MILFVGDKPSSQNTSPEIAFVGTRSHITLMRWISEMNVFGPFKLINRIDKNFEVELEWALFHRRTPVIALGKEAEKAILDFSKRSNRPLNMEMVHVLPHPSGRNLKLNDKKYVDTILKECHTFLDKYGYVFNRTV